MLSWHDKIPPKHNSNNSNLFLMNRQLCSIRSFREPGSFHLVAQPPPPPSSPRNPGCFPYPHNQSWFTTRTISAFHPKEGKTEVVSKHHWRERNHRARCNCKASGKCGLQQDSLVHLQNLFGSGNKLYTKREKERMGTQLQ